jgi:hypothetical protein
MLSHYSLTILTSDGDAWLVTYPTHYEASTYALRMMGDATVTDVVLFRVSTLGHSKLVKRYRRDNV